MNNTPVIVPFKAEHLLDYDFDGDPKLRNLQIESAKLWERGFGFTAILDNHAIGSAGLFIIWPGLAEAWAVFNDKGRRNFIWIHRTARVMLNEGMVAFSLRRVQALVLADKPLYRRWLHSLGFKMETILKNYGPHGEDFVLYAIVR